MPNELLCCGCPKSQAAGPLGVVACDRNRALIFASVKYVVGAISTVIIGAGVYLNNLVSNYNDWWAPQKDYVPFSFSSKMINLKMNVVETSKIMEGTPENDRMLAHPHGSKMFAKGGLNYIKLDAGADQLFYSLCSTDIIDNKVSVVENFDITLDKLYFFCTNKTITPKDIIIRHDNFDEHDITYIEVRGTEKTSAIALLGDISIAIDDIILNQKWGTV